MKIDLNLNNTKKFNKHFCYGINCDHAPQLLRKDLCEQIKFVHDTLHVKYLRFHGILSDDMHLISTLKDIFPLPGSERFVTYDFTQVGEVYDNVLECGFTPFVELSFMPKLLAKDTSKRILFTYGGNSGMPKDDALWQDFIKQFVSFLIDRYGKQEIEKWPFEVWNEPDLVVFFGDTKEDYFHLYELTARAIKEVDKNIKVGGPATSGCKWAEEFIKFTKDNNVPLDFISTHQYASDSVTVLDTSGENISPFANRQLLDSVSDGEVLKGFRKIFVDKTEIRDINPLGFVDNAKKTREIVKDLPLFLTEWNENAVFSSFTNDTKKVSAFLIYAALKTDQFLDGSMLWCASDIFEELGMHFEEFHGGFGILTHHGIPKTSYHALRLLNELSEDRYDVADTYEDITLGAFKSNNKDLVILTRQNMKNLDLGYEDIELSINRNKVHKVTAKFINREHGNPLPIYEEMGSPKHIKKEQIKSIIEKSKVEEIPLPYEIKDNKLIIKTKLEINDVCLISIE